MFKRQTYSLAKSHRILRKGFHIYKKRAAALSSSQLTSLETTLKELEEAIFQKHKTSATRHAKEVEKFLQKHFPKGLFDHSKELLGALLFAIVVAFFIRQFWFELYEVPTGSMRPTIKELDRLVVNKTTFGLNLPFQKGLHLYDEKYLKRGGIIVFTVADMDVPDADMRYFYLFPGKKRYIKRLIAKGGDQVYFYGGYIYGIDKNDKPFYELADPEWLKKVGIEKIDHVPYISFEGKTQLKKPLGSSRSNEATFLQMNQPVAKLDFNYDGKSQGTFFNGKEWIKDQPNAIKDPHQSPQSLNELWGFRNYAMARVLTPGEVKLFYPEKENLPNAPLYLELHHSANLTYPAPALRQGEKFIQEPTLTPYTSLIPLDQHHLNNIMDHMVTARFYVRNGHAFRYTERKGRTQPYQLDAHLPNVPDGLYEFTDGTAYAVHFGGIRTPLSHNHPLYLRNVDNIHTLFNLGIHFNTLYDPIKAQQPFVPQRFAYFRNGDLFVLGAPIFSKDDPLLKEFTKNERSKEERSTSSAPYVPFVDMGAPLKNGEMDIEFIKAFGLKIPEGYLLALGDNYAMSADSREFGFVPVENLRGAPGFLFWPPSTRLGPMPQVHYPFWTLPNVLVLSCVMIVLLLTWYYTHQRRKRRLF